MKSTIMVSFVAFTATACMFGGGDGDAATSGGSADAVGGGPSTAGTLEMGDGWAAGGAEDVTEDSGPGMGGSFGAGGETSSGGAEMDPGDECALAVDDCYAQAEQCRSELPPEACTELVNYCAALAESCSATEPVECTEFLIPTDPGTSEMDALGSAIELCSSRGMDLARVELFDIGVGALCCPVGTHEASGGAPDLGMGAASGTAGSSGAGGVSMGAAGGSASSMAGSAAAEGGASN